MPPFEFSREHNAFVKECSTCGTIYVGSRNQEEAEAIFHKSFHHHSNSEDGFQSQCRKCQHEYMRRRSGVAGEFNVEAIYKSQNGACAICCEPIRLYQGRGGGTHLDHDHKTGKVRGLLCANCNTALGKFKDSPTILKSALDYLNKHLQN